MKLSIILVALVSFAAAELKHYQQDGWCFTPNAYLVQPDAYRGRIDLSTSRGYSQLSYAKSACEKMGAECGGVYSPKLRSVTAYRRHFVQLAGAVLKPASNINYGQGSSYTLGVCPVVPVDPNRHSGWCIAVGKTLTGQSIETDKSPKAIYTKLTEAMESCSKLGRFGGCGGFNYFPANTTYDAGDWKAVFSYYTGRTLVNSTTKPGTGIDVSVATWLPRWGNETCQDVCDTCVKSTCELTASLVIPDGIVTQCDSQSCGSYRGVSSVRCTNGKVLAAWGQDSDNRYAIKLNEKSEGVLNCDVFSGGFKQIIAGICVDCVNARDVQTNNPKYCQEKYGKPQEVHRWCQNRGTYCMKMCTQCGSDCGGN